MVMQVAFAALRGFGQFDEAERPADWKCYAILSERVVVKGPRPEHLANWIDRRDGGTGRRSGLKIVQDPVR
jgi:hypothetical protein